MAVQFLLFAHAASSVLVYQDVNILAVTDVHAWIAGGDRQTSEYDPPITHTSLDATFGDLISFAARTKAAAQAQGKDIFLVDNGDIVDGTGLSNVVDDHCTDILPLYATVPFDALNCGNHELYDNKTLRAFKSSGYIAGWKGSYLTSNLAWSDGVKAGESIGAKFKLLVGPTSGVRLLAFGFMYDMLRTEGRCAAVDLITVESTVTSSWFTAALTATHLDAVLILAHMDAHEPLLATIVSAIRKVLPEIPIQIIAGHSHVRATAMIDPRAAVFEPGNYFNTVGFASFDLPPSTPMRKRKERRKDVAESVSSNATALDDASIKFTFIDLDTSIAHLASSVGTISSKLPTTAGAALTAAIAAKRAELGLSTVLGCSTKHYAQGAELNALYFGQVVPEELFTPPRNASQFFIQSTSGLRYDLYQGNVTVDDCFYILPFKDTFSIIRLQTAATLKKLLVELNHAPPPAAHWRASAATASPSRVFGGSFYDSFPSLSGVAPMHFFDLIVVSFDLPFIEEALRKVAAGGAAKTFDVVPFRAAENYTDTKMFESFVNASLGGGPCMPEVSSR